MNTVPLQALDLNLLLVFEALVEEQNVTRAAAKVGLSQPAVSSALGRLRRITGDPLFRRDCGRMQPTPRAHQLSGPILGALAQLRQTLELEPAFDPATATREFRIATNDYAEAMIVGPLLPRIAAAAPGVSIRTLRTGYLFEPPAGDLRSGDVDLALGFFHATAPGSEYVTRKVHDDPWVVIAREGHPSIRRRLDLRRFLEVPHVRVLYPRDERYGIVDTLLLARNLHRRVAVTVPHMLAVPHVVAATDFIGLVPERLARVEAAARRVRVFKSPLPLPDFTSALLWHQRTQFDPAQQWLRDFFTTRG